MHSSFYRPQRSWAKVMFLQACVCPQGRVLPQCMLGYHPPPPPPTPGSRPPQDQADPRTRQTPPDQADTPLDQADDPPRPGRPPGAGPPRTRQMTPQTRQTPQDQADPPGAGRYPPGPGRPPREADSRIRSTSGRYTSYWNAFLFMEWDIREMVKK